MLKKWNICKRLRLDTVLEAYKSQKMTRTENCPSKTYTSILDFTISGNHLPSEKQERIENGLRSEKHKLNRLSKMHS